MRHSIALFAFLISLCGTAQAYTVSYNDRIQAVTNTVPYLPVHLSEQLSTSPEPELLKILTTILSNYRPALLPEQEGQLTEIRQDLLQHLKDFKVSGCCFAGDPNLAFFYNNQNPTFTMTYVNPKGEVKSRTFESSIESWGLKIELSVRIDMIFFTGTNIDFLETDKQIQLGTGIDITFGCIGLVYVPFLNAPGGMLILSGLLGVGGGTSLVTGGYLRPISTSY
ncbi:hypothetical protein FJ365_04930 [Candidatus Dependentiae bacterium]|nr:hypothetical protein [Candidatus Dependentiae bacterium]